MAKKRPLLLSPEKELDWLQKIAHFVTFTRKTRRDVELALCFNLGDDLKVRLISVARKDVKMVGKTVLNDLQLPRWTQFHGLAHGWLSFLRIDDIEVGLLSRRYEIDLRNLNAIITRLDSARLLKDLRKRGGA
jgi:hypothetical protein